MGSRPLLIATRCDEGKYTRVALTECPVTVSPEVDALMGTWWMPAGGHPVGAMFGSVCGG